MGILVIKFGGYCETIAQILATEGAKQYIRTQTQFLQKWATLFDPTNHNDLTASDKIGQVMALINNGADLGFSNAQGITPLYAVLTPFIEAEMPSHEQRVAYANTIVQVVQLLMQYGAKHRVLQPIHKRSLLSVAVKISAWTNSTNLVKALLDVGLSMDVLNSDMGYTGTSLHDAVTFRSPALVTLLLTAGADTTKTNRNSLTPLEQARHDLACETSDITLREIVQLLEANS